MSVIRSREKALEVLDLQEGASEIAIAAMIKRLFMMHHPDRGGDREMFERVAQAKKILMVKKCPYCDGTGIVRVKTGSMTKKTKCEECKDGK